MAHSDLRIISFLIYNLKKNSVIEYLHTFIEKADTCPTIVRELAKFLIILKNAFSEAERIYHITLKSPLTELITMVDGQRDGIITGLKALVRSFEKAEKAEQREAARVLMVGLSSIKLNRNDQYIEQTGQVDNLLHFLQAQEAEAVQTLNLVTVVTLLKNVNDRMHELIEGRVDEVLNKEVGAFANARQAAEEAYRQFVLSVNSWAVLNADKLDEGSSEDGSTMSVAEFIRWANANIELYNIKLLKEPTDKVEEEVEDAEDDETTPPTETTPTKYIINFNHNGQTVASFELEAGAAVTAPSAPSGYHWVNVPATMPAENVTVTTEEDSNGGFTPPSFG